MPRILGLDLGSNSIGWAIRDTSISKDEKQVIKYGVKIFEEGIKLEKSGPTSKANERTLARSMRRNYFRRLNRKYKVLKLLIEESMCPLNIEDLNNWVKPEKKRYSKYPENFEFRRWLALDFDYDGIADYNNPYELRAKAVEQKLSSLEIGRAFYHLTQRRGFKSNRKVDIVADDESTAKQNELGVVKSSIQELESRLEENETYGQHFSKYDTHKERIRGKFLDRKKLEEEFDRIVEANSLDETLAVRIKNEIFFQRPLKSQKHNIGYCTLETSKNRCPISHFYFEEFRMLQFINSIKYKTQKNENEFWNDNTSNELISLSAEHKELILPLFYRVSKPKFTFKDIADKINKATKQEFIYNYKHYATVSGCPATSKIISAIGDEKWLNLKDENIKGKNKVELSEAGKGEVSKEDVWNVLFSYDDNDKIIEWSKKWLNLTDEEAKKFSNINFAQGYAALSKTAIRKILVYLRKGFIYSYSVFMANLDKVLGNDIWQKEKETIGDKVWIIIDNAKEYSKLIQLANSHIYNFLATYEEERETYTDSEVSDLKNRILEIVKNEFGTSLEVDIKVLFDDFEFQLNSKLKGKNIKFLEPKKIETLVKDFLISEYQLNSDSLKHLYHPSAIENFRLKEGVDSKLYLDKPFVKGIKNPVLNRALFQIRQLINYLIKQGFIDNNTRVHIEFGRELNSINLRMAYENWQKQREKMRAKAIDEIKKLYFDETKKDISPTETDVLKYLLWEEQNRKCLYTNKQISISDLLNGEKFDIEHTIPRSKTLDNSQENKTICCSYYNRNTKKNKIPYKLSNYDKQIVINGVTHPAICDNIKETYKAKLDELKKKFETLRKKGKSDSNTRQKHELSFEIKYYSGKIHRFEMKEIPDGFRVSQGVDISIINRYAAEMLKSYFDRVIVFQSRILKDVKDYWEVDVIKETAKDNNDLKKDRSFHHHHAVDAVSLTFLRKEVYDNLAKYYRIKDENDSQDEPIKDRLPFIGFKEFVQGIRSNIIINHLQKDYSFRQTKKILRKKGKIDYYIQNENGKQIKQKKYAQGQGVRMPLHQDSYFGAINIDGEIKYVIRRTLDENNYGSIKDFEKIIDPAVRNTIIEAVSEAITNGMTFKEAINQEIYLNKEKNVRIKKVRCFARVNNPIHLKEHKMISQSKDNKHKQFMYVQNDGNYLVVIYDKYEKGMLKRNSYVYSNLEMAQLKTKNISVYDDFLSKHQADEGIEIYCMLRKGDMVLFYENSPDEIKWNDIKDLSNRLYYANDFAGNQDKRIKFRHHLEARNDEKLRNDMIEKFGENYEKTIVTGRSKFEIGKYCPKLNLSTNNFNFFVIKKHFIITEDGNILKL